MFPVNTPNPLGRERVHLMRPTLGLSSRVFLKGKSCNSVLFKNK